MIKKQREKQYAVFGLGRFGTSVALTLNELGYQVMGCLLYTSRCV